MQLPTRRLGQTDIMLSCLGLGTVKFGRNQAVKYPRDFELPTDQEISELLELGRELGLNLLDTAPAYGSSESRLGKLLRQREDWVICTKVGEEFSSGKSWFDFSADHTRSSVERSLRRLRTDYLDLVLVHSDGNDLDIIDNSDCLAVLDQLKAEGLIRATGFSSKSVAGGLRALELCDAVMVTYNPAATDDAAVIDAALSRGKGVLVKKALQSGHAAGGQGVAHNLAFALAKPGVTSVIVGSINPEHLKSNVAAVLQALGSAA